MLDGRIARLSKTDSRFGAELDSLVDVISFGVAPAVLMYHLEFAAAGGFAWLVCFAYVVAVAVRLARFNLLTETKEHSAWFNGLPSPSAGMILGVYYPFSQTSWYAATLARFNGQVVLVLLILLLSVLMMSNVRYPKLPGIGFRTMRGRMGLALNLTILTGGILIPEYFFFPFGMAYVTYGLGRATILGFLERGDGHEQELAEAEDELGDPPVTLYEDSTTRRSERL
jgi:CDP-diacylglycerol--serine O-phosphatidyltransferase